MRCVIPYLSIFVYLSHTCVYIYTYTFACVCTCIESGRGAVGDSLDYAAEELPRARRIAATTQWPKAEA